MKSSLACAASRPGVAGNREGPVGDPGLRPRQGGRNRQGHGRGRGEIAGIATVAGSAGGLAAQTWSADLFGSCPELPARRVELADRFSSIPSYSKGLSVKICNFRPARSSRQGQQEFIKSWKIPTFLKCNPNTSSVFCNQFSYKLRGCPLSRIAPITLAFLLRRSGPAHARHYMQFHICPARASPFEEIHRRLARKFAGSPGNSSCRDHSRVDKASTTKIC